MGERYSNVDDRGGNMKAPCQDCTDREVGCHSSCDKYKAFKQKCDELRELRNRKKQEEYAFDHSRFARACKIKQKQKTKYWY
jgi:hypothetical protein